MHFFTCLRGKFRHFVNCSVSRMKRSIGNAEFTVIAIVAILNDVMVLLIAIPLNTYSCYLEGLIPQYYIVVFIRYYINYGKKNKQTNKTKKQVGRGRYHSCQAWPLALKNAISFWYKNAPIYPFGNLPDEWHPVQRSIPFLHSLQW